MFACTIAYFLSHNEFIFLRIDTYSLEKNVSAEFTNIRYICICAELGQRCRSTHIRYRSALKSVCSLGYRKAQSIVQGLYKPRPQHSISQIRIWKLVRICLNLKQMYMYMSHWVFFWANLVYMHLLMCFLFFLCFYQRHMEH